MVHSTSDSTIRAVSAEVFGDADDAQYAVETKLPPTSKAWSVSQDPFSGAPLTVPVMTCRTGWCGLWWAYPMQYSQGKFVVVIVQHQDGKREGRMIDIPDLRKRRTASVDFP